MNLISSNYFRIDLWVPVFLIIGVILYFNLSYEVSFLCIIFFIVVNLLIAICAKFIISNDARFYISCLLKAILFIQIGFLASKIEYRLYQNKYIQIKNDIDIKEARFRIHDIVASKLSNSYVCFLLSNDKLLGHGYLRFCTNNRYVLRSRIGQYLTISEFTMKALKDSIFEYDFKLSRHYFFKGIVAVAYSLNICKSDAGPSTLSSTTIMEKVNQWRYDLSLKMIDRFGTSIGSIIAAVIFGNRMFIPDEINDILRKSSIYHLIAISGLHISFISLLFLRLLFKVLNCALHNHFSFQILYRTSLILVLIAASIYLTISGIVISATRAFIMFFISILFAFNHLQIISHYIIIYSFSIIIILMPHDILGPGLAMSMLAISSLFLFDSKAYKYKLLAYLETKTNLSPWVNKSFLTILFLIIGSLMPHIATTPITIYYFNNFTTYSFLTNIVAIPLMSIIIFPLIIINLIIHSGIISKALDSSINLLLTIGSKVSSLAYTSFNAHQISHAAFFTMLIGILWLLIWQSYLRFLGLAIYILGICLCLQSAWPDIIVFNQNAQPNILINNGTYFTLLSNTRQDKFFLTKILDKNNHAKINKIKFDNTAYSYLHKKGQSITLFQNKGDITIQLYKFSRIQSELFLNMSICNSYSIKINNKINVKCIN